MRGERRALGKMTIEKNGDRRHLLETRGGAGGIKGGNRGFRTGAGGGNASRWIKVPGSVSRGTTGGKKVDLMEKNKPK